jgi:hypothetical protein
MIAVESPDPVIVRLGIASRATENSIPEIVGPTGVPSNFSQVLVLIQNKGRTNMTIKRFCIELLVSPTLPPTPIYQHLQTDWKYKLGKDETNWVRADPLGDIQLSEADRTAILNLESYLWAFGFFAYSNFIGDEFDFGFLARWDITKGFVREPNHNYEYQHPI